MIAPTEAGLVAQEPCGSCGPGQGLGSRGRWSTRMGPNAAPPLPYSSSTSVLSHGMRYRRVTRTVAIQACPYYPSFHNAIGGALTHPLCPEPPAPRSSTHPVLAMILFMAYE